MHALLVICSHAHSLVWGMLNFSRDICTTGLQSGLMISLLPTTFAVSKNYTHGTSTLSNASSTPATSSAARTNQAVVDFIEYNMGNYAHSALPFVSDAHIAVATCRESGGGDIDNETTSSTLRRLVSLDALYHAMTSNDVTRRASKAQGVALLTLFSKGFSKPQLMESTGEHSGTHAISRLVDDFKLRIRKEEIHGHLPICWGILTAALGMSLGTRFGVHSRYLKLTGTQNGRNIYISFFKPDRFCLLRSALILSDHTQRSSCFSI